MTTTLLLPRYTRGGAPDARTLARLIAHDLGLGSSWEARMDHNRSLLVVDLADTDPTAAADTCRALLDQHDIRWEIRS